MKLSLKFMLQERQADSFISRNKKDFITHGVDLTYGTIRLIEKDNDSFFAWATELHGLYRMQPSCNAYR